VVTRNNVCWQTVPQPYVTMCVRWPVMTCGCILLCMASCMQHVDSRLMSQYEQIRRDRHIVNITTKTNVAGWCPAATSQTSLIFIYELPQNTTECSLQHSYGDVQNFTVHTLQDSAHLNSFRSQKQLIVKYLTEQSMIPCITTSTNYSRNDTHILTEILQIFVIYMLNVLYV